MWYQESTLNVKLLGLGLSIFTVGRSHIWGGWIGDFVSGHGWRQSRTRRRGPRRDLLGAVLRFFGSLLAYPQPVHPLGLLLTAADFLVAPHDAGAAGSGLRQVLSGVGLPLVAYLVVLYAVHLSVEPLTCL